MIGRLQHKADFARVLAMPPCLRSTHFVVHHLQARPSTPAKRLNRTMPAKLCTDPAPVRTDSVDNSVSGIWLGQVLPKRHARRAVTRNLLRRQVRAAVQRHEASLRPGLWLVRLRQPFCATQFRAAASGALRVAAASELDGLLARAAS
jgi:ribonuclease P protein component